MHGKGRCAWQRGACIAKRGPHGKGGHAWQGACVTGVCGRGVHGGGGHVWQGERGAWQGGMHGGGCVWQGACVAGGMCGRGVCGERNA